MAKEKFLIIAVRMPDDCFSRFSETANREAVAAGTADATDPYSWIEASFEIVLVRWREATHICSFTPSARYEWLQNYFVGTPNAAWDYDGDPDALEYENGGEIGGYTTYHDDYPENVICESFTVDSMKHLDPPMRKPPADRRGFNNGDACEKYTEAVWAYAIEAMHEMNCNGVAGQAPILMSAHMAAA